MTDKSRNRFSNNPSEEDEILDIVDENDRVIGSATRSNIYSKGLRNFRVVNGFLINSSGKIWIPKRSPRKKDYPLCLDASIGGHVKKGESYEEAFRRELREELNLELSQVSYRLLGYLTPQRDKLSAFMKVYQLHLDHAPDYNPNEFVDYFWLTPKEILDVIHEGAEARSDLPKLVRIFFASEVRPANYEFDKINLSDPDLQLDTLPRWILKYYQKWQHIKNKDNRDKIVYPTKLDWATYYSLKIRIGFESYINYHTRRLVENYPFYNLLLGCLGNNSAIELGLGAGTGLIELTAQGKNVLGIDIEKPVLSLVLENAVELSILKKPVVVLADLLKTPFRSGEFTISYCHGTFEHFEGKLIIAAMKEALRISRKLIFAVPTNLAANPKYRQLLTLGVKENKTGRRSIAHMGDEKYLTTSRWETVIKKAGGEIEDRFGYWIPEFQSKTLHPLNARAYYGPYHSRICLNHREKPF